MPEVSSGTKKLTGGAWTTWALRMPQALKDLLHSAAMEMEKSMSDIVRTATFQYLAKWSPDAAEVMAAEISLRARKERIKLEKAKDQYRTRMKPVQAWRTVQEERAEYERCNILERADYDAWIERLQSNKDSIEEDNPERERILRKFDLLIEQLGEQQEVQFPQEGHE